MKRLLGALYMIVTVPVGYVYSFFRPGNKTGLNH
jgi:cbb3-type cytochrome oxidase subunit 3